MTVAKLIRQLQKIKDKNQQVIISTVDQDLPLREVQEGGYGTADQIFFADDDITDDGVIPAVGLCT